VVVRKGEIEYLNPVVEERLTLHCQLPDSDTMAQFVERINEKGMARIGLTIEVKSNGQLAIRFQGAYTIVTAEQISRINRNG